MLDHIERHTEEVEKFERLWRWERKYNRGHNVSGQWVLVTRKEEVGEYFLVAVGDRTAETTNLFDEAVDPSWNYNHSDSWASYSAVSEGYHKRVHHSVTFVDRISGAHTDTTEAAWRHVGRKVTLNPCSRQTA
jgi:hypothetical protein